MTKASDNPYPSALFEDQGSAPSTPSTGYSRVFTKSDGLYVVDDAGSVTGPFIDSGGGESLPDWLSDTYDLRAYPASPNALDDEFEGSGSIDGKWTIVNDPGLDQTSFPGYLYGSLTELGTDNFDNLVRIYQTPPSGAAAATYIARVAIAMSAEGYLTDGGEFSTAAIYLGDSTNDAGVSRGHPVQHRERGSIPSKPACRTSARARSRVALTVNHWPSSCRGSSYGSSS